MNCWRCGRKMDFIGRDGAVRRFSCRHCQAVTTIADGHKRRNSLPAEVWDQIKIVTGEPGRGMSTLALNVQQEGGKR